MASLLRLVILPCVAALLLTALLKPLTARLRQLGLPSLAATWCTVLAALAVLAGAATLAVTQTSANYPTLVNDVGDTTDDLQRWLAGPPFHMGRAGLARLSGKLVTFLKDHQSEVAGTVSVRRQDLPGARRRAVSHAVRHVLPAQGRRADLGLADLLPRARGPGAAPAARAPRRGRR